MNKIIILNGPPFSGKDYAAGELKYIFDQVANTHHMEFKEKLFELTKAIFNVSNTVWDNLYTRQLKEVPSVFLQGLSPRQALIKVSEEVIKPVFGKTYFGESLARQILYTETEDLDLFFISDGGFPEEVQPLIESFGEENIIVVRVHTSSDFTGDSRRYLPDGLVKYMYDVENNFDTEFVLDLSAIVLYHIMESKDA